MSYCLDLIIVQVHETKGFPLKSVGADYIGHRGVDIVEY